MSIANDKQFLDLVDAIVVTVSNEFKPDDEVTDLAAYVDGLLELRAQAAARLVNDALEMQHERINRMESALQEIKRAAANGSPIAWAVVLDLAEAGLRVNPATPSS